MSAGYWRSLGELEDTPESRAFREREFPEGASEAPDAVSRRTLLQLLGATAGAAGLTAACRRPEEHIVPYVEAPEQVVPGVPRHYATTMPNGTSAYGLVVESHEGRPTKVEGNELHPASLGSSSARVQASVLDLYDPDRSQTVLRRGERSSWADFVAAWTARVKAHSDGEGLAVLDHASRLADARAPGGRVPESLPARPLRDLGARLGCQRARGPRARRRPAARTGLPAREGEGHPRDRRRHPARRPRDGPPHARLRGRASRPGARRRDEPAVGGRSRALDHRRQRRPPSASPGATDPGVRGGARGRAARPGPRDRRARGPRGEGRRRGLAPRPRPRPAREPRRLADRGGAAAARGRARRRGGPQRRARQRVGYRRLPRAHRRAAAVARGLRRPRRERSAPAR